MACCKKKKNNLNLIFCPNIIVILNLKLFFAIFRRWKKAQFRLDTLH